MLRFDVYDLDSESRNLKDHDFIGTYETTLGHIMGSRGQTASGELVLTNPNSGVVGVRGSGGGGRGGGGGGGGGARHPHRLQKKTPSQRGGGSFSSRVMGAFRGGKKKGRGRLVVRAEEVSGCADVARFCARGLKLDRKNWFGLGHADPFLSIYRSREDGQWVRVWQSEVIKHTINPTWRPAAVPVQQICNGDLDRPIMLEVLDWESSGSHGMIGRCTTSLRAIVEPAGGRGPVRFVLVNDALKKKKGAAYKGSGTLEFYRADVLRQHTLLEYVRGGTELALMVAVDFTASNARHARFLQRTFVD